VVLEDLRGRAVVLAIYIADWHPVATAQLTLYQELLPHLRRLDATVLGISVDVVWSHQAFTRASGIGFPLLADDAPPGAVARAYGVFVPDTGRSRRALFVIDGEGIVRWSAIFPDVLNPGADGILSALEALRPAAGSGAELSPTGRDGAVGATCASGCGLSAAQVSSEARSRPHPRREEPIR
jgi:peroxiredoxin (alkyl hydroperoxide reductase subunit C)